MSNSSEIHAFALLGDRRGDGLRRGGDVRGDLLQHRIAVEFRPEHGLELQDRRLKHLERLAQLGRQHEAEPLILGQGYGLVWHGEPICATVSFL